MTRTDILWKNLEVWMDHGLAGAMLGLESVRQNKIKRIRKGTESKIALRLVDRLLEREKKVIGFYMIGFEDDTAESIQADVRGLAKLGLDLVQVCILTPLHGTPLWDYVYGKYGEIDSELRLHDMKHLVWNHPLISREEMRNLLQWCFEVLYPPYQLEYVRTKGISTTTRRGGCKMPYDVYSCMAFFRDDDVLVEHRPSPCRIGPDNALSRILL